MKVTRRSLAAMLAVAPVAAQTPSSPDEMVRLAQENNRRSQEAMKKVKLPMSTEPAFVFKA